MLYISTNSNGDSGWHIGEQFPNRSWDVVTKVQADGDELEYLYEKFPSLPKCKFRVVTFIGDDAKFIVANLGNK